MEPITLQGDMPTLNQVRSLLNESEGLSAQQVVSRIPEIQVEGGPYGGQEPY